MTVTKARSFAKALSYRIWGTLSSFVVAYVITGKGSLSALIAMWETIVKVGHGDAFSLALTSFGRVFSWGDDFYSGIEIDPPENSLYPADITSAFDIDSQDEIEIDKNLFNLDVDFYVFLDQY